ncbi:MAG: YqeG family HAD IIIA-type phosphatase [Caulobacteraceae bacterium]
MKKRLKPDLYIKTVHELDTGILREKGITGIIIDIDNTLVSWDTKEPDEKVISLVCKLAGEGFKICILSNNTRRRVEEFNKCLKLPAIHKAVKPSKGAFRRAMRLLDTDNDSTAVIGDQLFTDVYGGNRLGLFTILVPPISDKEFIWTRFVRIVEKSVLRRQIPGYDKTGFMSK